WWLARRWAPGCVVSPRSQAGSLTRHGRPSRAVPAGFTTNRSTLTASRPSWSPSPATSSFWRACANLSTGSTARGAGQTTRTSRTSPSRFRLVDVRSNLDNPALLPLLDARSATYGGEQELRSLTRDSLEYVHELVAWMLRDRGWPLDYLAPLYDVFADTSVTHLDVFTLNHDLILDRGLTEHRISFSDGFEERQGTLLLWTDTYSVPSRRFFKLRGSLNWYRYNLDLDGWTGQVVAKPAPGTSSEHPVGPRGEDLGSPCERRAEFLAGRFTKILAYPSGIYADQHARFHESLRIADGVLVVGYGFRDRAINSRLISWMTRPRATPRMVVIDPAAADIEQRAREAIALKWRRWLSSAAVVAAANRLGEETPWPELRAALTARTSTSTPARGRIRSKPPDRSLGQGRRRRPDGLTAPRSRARPRPNAAH